MRLSREQRALLDRFSHEDLREALVVSQLDVQMTEAAPAVTVVAAEGSKCARCWKFRELGNDAAHPDVCSECAAVLDGLD